MLLGIAPSGLLEVIACVTKNETKCAYTTFGKLGSAQWLLC